MKLKKSLLFRLEFFGGIIIDKNTFDRIELTFDEALFIKAVEFLKVKEAERLVCDILKKDSIDIERLFRLQVFSSDDVDTIPYIDVYSMICEEYNKINDKMYLSFPLEIAIYPSMKCNLNCKFCFLGCKKDTKVYGAEYWGNIIEQGKAKGLLSVSILGGEPALYYDIDRLLKKCDDLEINTVITTNTIKLKESTKRIIFNSKYITPAVSLQSLDNLNSLLMGCDYKTQIKFIEECLSHKKDVRINSVYTFQTFEQILKIYDFCVEKGIGRYSIANYSNTKDNIEMKYAHNLNDLAKLDEKVKKYIEKKYSNVSNLPTFSAEGCMLYSCYTNQVENKLKFSPFESQYFGCRGKYTKMEIYADGSVYPCYRFETVMSSTSNVFTENKSLEYIWWNDKNYKEIRQQKTNNSICLECPFIDICEGGCYPSRIKTYKDNVIVKRDENCQVLRGI